MKVLRLIIKNAGRHKLRTFLTILGLGLAVMAFGLIRTFIDAWYAGARAASPDRLVTRHAVSFTFPLPLAYEEQILKVEGVKDITYGTWFGGIYVDAKNFFMQFGVEPESFFRIYNEYIVPPDQMQNFLKDRRGAIVGQSLIDRFGWKVGDQVSLIGTIYPGDWQFVIDGIYHGESPDVDENAFIFNYTYVEERLKQESLGGVGQIGWYVLRIDDPSRAAEIGARVDARFDNSWAETKTETEKQFAMTFVAMGDAIIVGLRVISYLIIGVIFLVLANTMAMAARERVSENAFMRTLGFRSYHLVGLILGESTYIAVVAGLTGMVLLYVVVNVVAVPLKATLSAFVPVFAVAPVTYVMIGVIALVIGAAASVFPIIRVLRVNIVDGLRVVD
jgi:putative ABC transport system permease protein